MAAVVTKEAASAAVNAEAATGNKAVVIAEEVRVDRAVAIVVAEAVPVVVALTVQAAKAAEIVRAEIVPAALEKDNC